jgi:hypothetical protein
MSSTGSSDYTISNSIIYNDSIPVLAYGLIGVTSLVLAYATFMDDTGNTNNSSNTSATSMLPNVNLNPFSQGTQPASSPTQPVVAVPVTSSSPLKTMGGKSRRKVSDKKKTRRAKK